MSTWQPTFPPMRQPLPGDDELPEQPVRTPVNRNGLPEHRPYHSPPGTPRFDGFSGSCKRGSHGECRQKCGCFCHG